MAPYFTFSLLLNHNCSEIVVPEDVTKTDLGKLSTHTGHLGTKYNHSYETKSHEDNLVFIEFFTRAKYQHNH